MFESWILSLPNGEKKQDNEAMEGETLNLCSVQPLRKYTVVNVCIKVLARPKCSNNDNNKFICITLFKKELQSVSQFE